MGEAQGFRCEYDDAALVVVASENLVAHSLTSNWNQQQRHLEKWHSSQASQQPQRTGSVVVK
jgi:hypothetical protein